VKEWNIIADEFIDKHNDMHIGNVRCAVWSRWSYSCSCTKEEIATDLMIALCRIVIQSMAVGCVEKHLKASMATVFIILYPPK
jgi:hypothetical protein